MLRCIDSKLTNQNALFQWPIRFEIEHYECFNLSIAHITVWPLFPAVIANLTACDSEMSHPDKILTQIRTRILSWQKNSQSLYIYGVQSKINGEIFLETLSECCDLSQASFRNSYFLLASDRILWKVKLITFWKQIKVMVSGILFGTNNGEANSISDWNVTSLDSNWSYTGN